MNIFLSVHMYYVPEGLSTDLMVLSYCGPIALSKQEGKAFAASIGLWEGESASLTAFFGSSVVSVGEIPA